ASRLDTIRIGVCSASGSDVSIIKDTISCCFREFALIPCPSSLRHLRTILVGFPSMTDAKGIASLKVVQGQFRLACLLEGLMIGRFDPFSEDIGLWNPEFRPMRSPIPMLALRHLVENDAPFVLRHPVLLPSYILRF